MKLLNKAKAAAAAIKDKVDTRKQLRGPADLRYAIADTISALNPEHWRAITQNASLFMSIHYLAALEQNRPANMANRYALIYAQDGLHPIAAMAMQLLTIDMAVANPHALETGKRKLFAPLAKEISDRLPQRILACGNFLTFGLHGLAVDDRVDSHLIWHGVSEVMYRVRQADKLSGRTQFALIKDLHGPSIKPAKYLENLSYRLVETEPNMVLTVQPSWKTYDDYLASLASKYRSTIKNSIFKPIEASGCTVESLRNLQEHEARIFALYRSVHENADFQPFTLLPKYFAALEQALGENFRCKVVKRGDTVLGFLICVKDGLTTIAYHIGFDRVAAEELPIYLRLLHESIADAIDWRCTAISFGRTALAPKAALGAKPEPFSVLVRHNQPVLNKLIKRLLQGIDHDEAPDRNPFKVPKENPAQP